MLKGIKLCAECAFYSMKKHKCMNGATDEGKATDKFYADCPLWDVVPVNKGEWVAKLYEASQDGDPYDYVLYHCSECGVPSSLPRNFCHNCGADNRGDDDG